MVWFVCKIPAYSPPLRMVETYLSSCAELELKKSSMRCVQEWSSNRIRKMRVLSAPGYRPTCVLVTKFYSGYASLPLDIIVAIFWACQPKTLMKLYMRTGYITRIFYNSKTLQRQQTVYWLNWNIKRQGRNIFFSTLSCVFFTELCRFGKFWNV